MECQQGAFRGFSCFLESLDDFRCRGPSAAVHGGRKLVQVVALFVQFKPEGIEAGFFDLEGVHALLMALVGKELGANEGAGQQFPIPRPFLDGFLFRERNAHSACPT